MDKWDLLGYILGFLALCFILFIYALVDGYESGKDAKYAKCLEMGNVPYRGACIKPGSFVNVEME